MAQIYNSVGGRKLSKVIALNEGVQAELETRTFEIAVRAEELLLEHRQEGHAEITVDTGKVDKYVTLNDERGQKAALSIEYGREAGSKQVRDPKTGEMVEVTWGEMDGLFILARASNLPKRRKGRVVL